MIRVHGITPTTRRGRGQPFEKNDMDISRLQFPLKYSPGMAEQDKQHWISCGFKFDLPQPKCEANEDANGTTREIEKKKPCCFICGRQFLYKSSLVNHLHSHVGKGMP